MSKELDIIAGLVVVSVTAFFAFLRLATKWAELNERGLI